MNLDLLDRRLLDAAQERFPLNAAPFAALAKKMGTTEMEVFARMGGLARTGVVREYGAVFDAARLGYSTTLCAAQVSPEAVERVAAHINRYDEVTHNYLRTHAFNMWFTLIARTPERVEGILESIRAMEGVTQALSFPSKQVFKIRVFFQTSDAESPETAAPPRAGAPRDFTLDEMRLIRVLSEPMPLALHPFAELARVAGTTEAHVLAKIQEWLADGTIRRFGARVDHRVAGFAANGMSVWQAPEERTDEAGRLMAQFPEVSHCYARALHPAWPYNLYAMIHGAKEEEVRETARRISEAVRLETYDVLFSTQELKKTAPRYFVDA